MFRNKKYLEVPNLRHEMLQIWYRNGSEIRFLTVSDSMQFQGIASVSYTHLDVYKRQLKRRLPLRAIQ